MDEIYRRVSFELIEPDLIQSRDIYLIDHPESELYTQLNAVAVAANKILFLSNFNTSVKSAIIKLYNNTNHKMVIIINIDIFDSVDEAIDYLLDIKRSLSEIVFILCSAEFSVDDFTLQRSAITHASFRLPCSRASLVLAVESGIRNSLLNAPQT